MNLQPLLGTLIVKVVLVVAIQQSQLIILLKLVKTDNAFVLSSMFLLFKFLLLNVGFDPIPNIDVAVKLVSSTVFKIIDLIIPFLLLTFSPSETTATDSPSVLSCFF